MVQETVIVESRPDQVVLSKQEAVELYRFTRRLYISYTEYPALRLLLSRLVVEGQ